MRSCWARRREKRAGDLELYIPPGPRLGNLVIEANGVSKAYGDRLLVEAWISPCRRAASSGSSVPTAPARPPCSG